MSESLPSYGDHFTWEEFREMCVEGSIIDYDGTARAATSIAMTDTEIYPSDVALDVVEDPPSHIMWFNR